MLELRLFMKCKNINQTLYPPLSPIHPRPHTPHYTPHTPNIEETKLRTYLYGIYFVVYLLILTSHS